MQNTYSAMKWSGLSDDKDSCNRESAAEAKAGIPSNHPGSTEYVTSYPHTNIPPNNITRNTAVYV